ncbi:glycan-binding surface protein [Niabella insulamsoli]|uniref:glycan-binding surface protein n=1 Tax=Niabella insulamsoli TaxID=3144874 RepID=UPI0031FBC195
MQTINKTLTSLLLLIVVAVLFASCKKETTGMPEVSYVRVTNPAASDSLLTAAGQGQLVAIIGKNLQDAREIWFNDRKSVLTPTYITSESILVSVPGLVPGDITNKLRILFKNGYELLHDFKVQISKPLVASMFSEFVNADDIAIINGDYFYAPVTVTFTGGAVGEIVDIADQAVSVRVPANAQPGPITIKTNFGETQSDFWFRDSRNIFISSDPYEGWWNGSLVISNPAAGQPPLINGNYIYLKKEVAAWSWTELAGGPASSMPIHSKRIPDDAILKPQDYNLKFEVNTLKPYNGNAVKINVGLTAEQNQGYIWPAPFDTQGRWQTVVIPLEEVFASYNPKPVVSAAGYWTRILVGNAAGSWDADIAFDNFRVVPKTAE